MPLEAKLVAAALCGAASAAAVAAFLHARTKRAAAQPGAKLGLQAIAARAVRSRSGRIGWLEAAWAMGPFNVRRQVKLAGWSESAVRGVTLARFALAASCGLAGFAAAGHLPAQIAAALVAACAGIALPDLVLATAVARRRRALERALPDAAGLISLCFSAGLTLESSIARACSALGPASPAMASALRQGLSRLAAPALRREAFSELAEAYGSSDLRKFAGLLDEASKTGAPTAAALAALAEQMREARHAAAERRAAALPPKLAAVVVIFFLPLVFVAALGPQLVRLAGPAASP